MTEPNPAGGADLDTDYTYNMFNQLTQTSIARSGTTQTRMFIYNSDQRLQTATHAESSHGPSWSFYQFGNSLALAWTDCLNDWILHGLLRMRLF